MLRPSSHPHDVRWHPIAYHAWSLLPFFLVTFVLPPCWGQEKVVIERHGSTPEGDIIRARADAVLAMKQAELIGEKAVAQRLENMITECDAARTRLSTRNQMSQEAFENSFTRAFDSIRFHQQLAEIRSSMQQNAAMRRTSVGDPTDDMNLLLAKFSERPLDPSALPVLKTELSPEQLDAIYMTDGANVFSARTGRSRIESFKWPFFLQRQEFREGRHAFEVVSDKAVQEIRSKGSPSPETILDLLAQLGKIEEAISSCPLPENASTRSVEMKWRNEAASFIRELRRTLANSSRLDAEKLAGYIFRGNTLGELFSHMEARGLRFSRPDEGDANLYASVFFMMRFAYQDRENAIAKTASVSPPPGKARQDRRTMTQGTQSPMSRPTTGTFNGGRATLVGRVTLTPPYPASYADAPTDRLSLQYAVSEICKQVGVGYQFAKSRDLAGSECRRWVTPRFENVPADQALDQLLRPLGVSYVIDEKGLYLRKGRPDAPPPSNRR